MSTTSPTSPASPTVMDRAKSAAKVAGKRASVVGQKAKLQAEIMLTDSKIKARKQKFGVELYNHLVVQAEADPHFIIESDTLTNIQGLFVTAFKDNKALLQKKAKKQNDLGVVADQRSIAFPIPAVSIGEKMVNAGKAATFTGKETAIKTKMSMLEREMKANKQKFGIDAYARLVDLEDGLKWLPSDRDVRFFYDQARREVQQIEQDKKQKEADLSVLGLQT